MATHRTTAKESRRFARLWAWVSFGSITLALLIAAVVSAPLTWDGAYYLFRIVDDGAPFVPHDRWMDVIYHAPVNLVYAVTTSIAASQFLFSFLHVINPLVALALSWLVVRHHRPDLLVWPAIAILLALLPGQINFVSEGIKAEQLMWPLLLAVAMGLRGRTWLVALVAAITIWFLHPVAAPILFASGLAAVALALIQPLDRTRLLPAGAAMIVIGGIRYLMVQGGTQQSEMSWETQQRQWENGAAGLPTIALWCSAGIIVIVLAARGRRGVPIWAGAALVLVSTISLSIWAAQPHLWWEALEFRGPAFWITMAIAGLMIANELVSRMAGWQPAAEHHMVVTALSVGFAVVLIVQSIAWNGVVQGLNHQMGLSSQACIALEDLPHYPFTPLNLWSTKSHSLLEQGNAPEKIVLPAAECYQAQTHGDISMGPEGYPITDGAVDLSALRSRLPLATTCTWESTEGWYQQEALVPDTWRWSGGEGTVLITMESAGALQLTVTVQSLSMPNDIVISLNGEEITTATVGTAEGKKIENLELDLRQGDNLLTFTSRNDPVLLPHDDRALAVSIWNLTLHPSDGSARCHWIQN